MCIIIMDCYECMRLLTHSRILLFENNQLVRTLQSGIELFDFNQYRLKSADDDVQKQIPHTPLKEGSFINIRGIETQCIHSFDVCLRPGEITYLIGEFRIGAKNPLPTCKLFLCKRPDPRVIFRRKLIKLRIFAQNMPYHRFLKRFSIHRLRQMLRNIRDPIADRLNAL